MSARVRGGSTGTPSPPIAVTWRPSTRKAMRRTDGKAVSVATTCAMREVIESDPPPEENSPERSTLAVPPKMSRSNSRVPEGIAVLSPTERSSAAGPARRARIAAAPMRGVAGTSRATGESFSSSRR